LPWWSIGGGVKRSILTAPSLTVSRDFSKEELMTRATRWGAVLAGTQSLFASAVAFAQDQATDVTVTTERTTRTIWYSEWWVWAVGVAVFLIVIVALTTRGGRSTPVR
jgi:hypothetical protein